MRFVIGVYIYRDILEYTHKHSNMSLSYLIHEVHNVLVMIQNSNSNHF